MEQFAQFDKQIQAVRSVRESHRQVIEGLKKEVADAAVEIETIQNTPIRDVVGEELNKVLLAQAEKIQIFQEKKAKAENRLSLMDNVVAPPPYSAAEMVAEFTNGLEAYKTDVLKPLTDKAVELKEQYLASIKAVDEAIAAFDAKRGVAEQFLKFDMGSTAYVPRIGNRPEEIFVNKEHQREFA